MKCILKWEKKTNFARSILLNLSYLMLLTYFICLCIILCPWVAHGTKIITSSVFNIHVCLVFVSFFRTLAFSTLKSKMHLILLDKKLTVFQGMKATYHLKATYDLTQLFCLTLLKNESKMNHFFNKLFFSNVKNNFQLPRRFRPPLSEGNKIYRSLSFCSG